MQTPILLRRLPAPQAAGLVDTIPRAAPVRNMALEFNGQDQWVMLKPATEQNGERLNFSNGITLEAWVLPVNEGEKCQTFRHDIVALSGSNSEEVFLRLNNGCWQVGSSKGGAVASWPVPEADWGRWVFLAGVYDKTSQQWSLYHQGQKVDQSGTDAQYSMKLDGEWTSGGRPGTQTYFHGRITALRIWRVSRTPEQIQTDMNFVPAGGVKIPALPRPIEILSGNWHMDEGYLNVAFDYSSTDTPNNGLLGGREEMQAPAWVVAGVPDGRIAMDVRPAKQPTQLPSHPSDPEGTGHDAASPTPDKTVSVSTEGKTITVTVEKESS